MNYTLAEDGDELERHFWPLLSELWPNYELLWQRFIAPMTMRSYDRSDVSLRHGTDRRLEEMCMAHYSVFYHIAHTHELVVQHGGEKKLPHHYDDMFFHMSAATEMVDRFLLVLCQIQCHVEGQQPAAPLTAEELVESANAFYEEHYQASYDLHLRQGRSVNIVLHRLRDLIKPVLVRSKTEDTTGKLWETAGHIREYRNVLTHNPLMPMMIGEQNVLLLPKRNKLKQYELWSAAIFGEDVEADYVAGPTLVQEFLEEFETRVNALWDKLIALLTEWSKTDEYTAMQPPIVEPGETTELKPRKGPNSGSPIRPSGIILVSDIPDWRDRHE